MTQLSAVMCCRSSTQPVLTQLMPRQKLKTKLAGSGVVGKDPLIFNYIYLLNILINYKNGLYAHNFKHYSTSLQTLQT